MSKKENLSAKITDVTKKLVNTQQELDSTNNLDRIAELTITAGKLRSQLSTLYAMEAVAKSQKEKKNNLLDAFAASSHDAIPPSPVDIEADTSFIKDKEKQHSAKIVGIQAKQEATRAELREKEAEITAAIASNELDKALTFQDELEKLKVKLEYVGRMLSSAAAVPVFADGELDAAWIAIADKYQPALDAAYLQVAIAAEQYRNAASYIKSMYNDLHAIRYTIAATAQKHGKKFNPNRGRMVQTIVGRENAVWIRDIEGRPIPGQQYIDSL